MKRFLYKLYSKILSILYVWKWSIDVLLLRKSIKKKTEAPKTVRGKLLVLIPHADDEWVGCSQLLCDEKLDVILLNVDMQGGDGEELHIHRRKELQQIANNYNRKLITIGDNKEQALRRVIEENSPNIICVPYFFDWHPEHIAVMNCLFRVVNDSTYKNDVLMYQVSLPILPEECNYWIPMNKDQWARKWSVFEEVYKSQISIPYKRFACNERINGAVCGDYAAEVYQLISADIWQSQLPNHLLKQTEIDKVKTSIMDIAKTRKFLSSFYKNRNN